MASSATVGQTSAPQQPEQVVCTPAFVFPAAAAFPGLDPRQHIANFIHHTQQPQLQQNEVLLHNNVKQHLQAQQQAQHQHTTTKVKQQRSSTSCNQQQVAPHQLTTAIAFPGNLLQQHTQAVQQQHLQQQPNPQQHSHAAILIPATAATSQVRNATSINFNNNASANVWPCPACKIPFKSASELQAHLSQHTKQEKSVPCNQCGKLFASAERVRIHVRVAHGEKSCSCEICGSGFSYRCKLLDHMRTHTGDKPFHCDVCGRSFSQKNHLRRHQMIHTGERPYPCEYCGRGFYRKDKLSRHRRIHTNPSSGSGGGRGARNANANNIAANSATTQQHIVASVAQTAPATIQLIPVHVATSQFRGTPITAAQWTAQQQQQQPETKYVPNTGVPTPTNNAITNSSPSTPVTPTTAS
jgi:hypothetical protein